MESQNSTGRQLDKSEEVPVIGATVSIKPVHAGLVVGSGGPFERVPLLIIARDHLEESMRLYVGRARARRPPEEVNEFSTEDVARVSTDHLWQILSEMAGAAAVEPTSNQPKQD